MWPLVFRERDPRIKLRGLQLRPILRQILPDSYSIFNIVSKSLGKVSVWNCQAVPNKTSSRCRKKFRTLTFINYGAYRKKNRIFQKIILNYANAFLWVENSKLFSETIINFNRSDGELILFTTIFWISLFCFKKENKYKTKVWRTCMSNWNIYKRKNKPGPNKSLWT